MNRVASFLLLACAIVFNSDARAIELECGEKTVVAGSWRLSPSAMVRDEITCQQKCNLQYGTKDFLTGDRLETVTCKPSVLNCSPKNTGVKEVDIKAQFIPPRGGPKHLEEPTPQRPQGECNCSAELKLEVECVPQLEVPPPPVAQASTTLCCAYEVPPTSEGLSFLQYIPTGALTVDGYSRDGFLLASFCSNGDTIGTFDSDMGADRYRLWWRHRLGLLLPEGFTGWIERDGFLPTEGATGIGFGFCWLF
jgi:hypothetical protein